MVFEMPKAAVNRLAPSHETDHHMRGCIQPAAAKYRAVIELVGRSFRKREYCTVEQKSGNYPRCSQ